MQTTRGRLAVLLFLLFGSIPAWTAEEPPPSWVLDAQQQIQTAEYAVSWSQGYQAPNRAQGFRTFFTDRGIRAVPRIEVEAGWEWGLDWVGYGRGSDLAPLPEAVLAPRGSRIDYRRGAFTEWYENGPRGLKQGFVLPAPPGGHGSDTPVHLDLALTGSLSPVISEDGQAIDFLDRDGARVLRYAELRVTDARGTELPSWMGARVHEGKGAIALFLDDREAVYPVTVDPLTFAAVWINESNQANAEFGRSVGTAGDVNGDGYSDVIVGAPLYDNGETDEGRAYVYLGSASGLAASPAWFVESNQIGARFGSSVGTAGDVNGDGFADVIVGAPRFDNGQTDEGAAFVYLGSAAGPSTSPVWTKEIDQGAARFGSAVATAGDVNGDGFADVIVGAYLYDNGNTDEGGAFVYLGSAGGPAATPVWTGEGNQNTAWFGYAVATAADTNADGYADVLVGAPLYDNGHTDEGRAYLYFGTASGVSPTANWFQESDQAGAQFGYSVATAGDIDGFGYPDILVGAWQWSNGHAFEGGVFVYLGFASGPSTVPITVIENNQPDSYMGWWVGPAGDVNGDGYADVLVTAPFYFTSPTVGGGQAIVYLGAQSDTLSFTWQHIRSLANAAYGASAATAGDVNGDGFSDIIVGAPWDDNGQTNEGLAYVYHGSSGFLSNLAGWNESNQPGAQAGVSVAAGDVNGDGYADMVVGVPFWDGGDTDEGKVFLYMGSIDGPVTSLWNAEGEQALAQFGASVGSAGDVNGDGYDDVIVGAPLYDNFVADDGRAVVYLGSAAGLSATHSWSTRGGVTGVGYGTAVGTAGDVNGDGFADVIVGAPQYSGQGRASVFLGSAAGLSTIASWTVLGGQASADYGKSVGTAGDVNGDGFSDVIVGAPRFDGGTTDSGRAFVYLGGSSGLATSPTWFAQSSDFFARTGASVASAGDTNGDGYADVLVGSPSAPAGGKADLYFGYSLGVFTTPAYTVQSDGYAQGEFGIAVAGAGDLNGDGYADVVIGGPRYNRSISDPDNYFGEARIHYGSATGINSFSSSASSGQANDRFGAAVAAAGDINGDGYADLAIGGPLYDAGQPDEGRFFIFQGGGIEGLAVNPRQRSSDGTRPIARGGASDVGTAFRLGALGRSPFGRGKVRLEWEVKPFGTLLNGTGIGSGAGNLDTGTVGAELQETIPNLIPGTRYHWRMRLVYDPVTYPFAKRSRWFTMPWGGMQEAMLRMGAAAAGRASTMTVFKVGLGVTIDWTLDSSCLESDADYALYEGTLGNFTSHLPVTCTSAPGSSWNFTPAAGNRYFLLVPVNATREGSYGLGAGGAERPASASACKPQAIAACP